MGKTEFFSTQRHGGTEGVGMPISRTREFAPLPQNDGMDSPLRWRGGSEADGVGFSASPLLCGEINSFSESGGKIYLLYGDQLVFRLSHFIGAQTMLGGQPIAVIDGCNRFDVHYLARFARQRKINPNQFLRKVFVSRGFTCYQMESAVGGKLPGFLKRISSRTAFIFGLLDTFYDQQAPYREVRQILERLLIKFHEMKTDGISLLLTSMDWKVIPEERNQLFDKLKKNADKVFHLTLNEEGQPKLLLEQENIPVCSIGSVPSVPFVPPVLKNLSV